MNSSIYTCGALDGGEVVKADPLTNCTLLKSAASDVGGLLMFSPVFRSFATRPCIWNVTMVALLAD